MDTQENLLLKIKDQIEEWTSANIGYDFTFRKNQLETIVHIINSIVNDDVRTHVIQAPTGTGKSLMCIIAAGVLAKYYDMRSYILASDLYLWKQYSDAIDKFKAAEKKSEKPLFPIMPASMRINIPNTKRAIERNAEENSVGRSKNSTLMPSLPLINIEVIKRKTAETSKRIAKASSRYDE